LLLPKATRPSTIRRSPIALALKALGSSDDFYPKAKEGILVMGGIYKCTKCTNWHASCAGGFLISADGKAVTNYHVVNAADNQALVAMTSDGTILPVKQVLAASKADDVAIVQLDVPRGVTLHPLTLGRDANPGSKLRVVSHPDSHFYTLTEGIVSRYSKEHGTTWMQVTADYARGSSGCPVFDERGQVIGMVANTESVYYTDENGVQKNLQMVIRTCVPVANVRKLIASP
jgi:serine protease Do